MNRCTALPKEGRREREAAADLAPWRLFPGLLITVLLVACGGGATPSPILTSTPEGIGANPNPAPISTPAEVAVPAAHVWKYVNSGWVSPSDLQGVGPLSQQLRAFVITSQEELDGFQQSMSIKVSRGTATSLGRVDFPKSILLAAYYLWRPLQGDPLSVVGFSLDGSRADVLLELEDSPQGKEYPYLFAPMAMVAIDRSHFPPGQPIDFVFHVNGEPQATVTATVE